MKFLCGTQEFLQAIQLVSRAISGQQALPILGNILFQAEGSTCIVSATDLELSMVTSFHATIEREGSITIPAKAILNFAQYNTDPEIVLETHEGTRLKCSSKHGVTQLSGEVAKEFPVIPTVEGKKGFSLDAAELLEALNLVTFASARSSLRPVLSGVHMRAEGKAFTLVSTDSYRLSEYTIAADVGAEISCIVPVKVLEELKILLGGLKPAKRTPSEEGEKQGARPEAKPVEVHLSDQQIEFTVGQTRLLSRLIEGKFPDYQQIIPKQHTTKAIVSTRDLLTAVKRMHYFAKEVNNNLTFSFTSGSLHISTPETQLGKDEADLQAETDGSDGKIALSSSYLLDFLSHISSDGVTLHMTDSMHPAVFRLANIPNFLHLIMPLRMQEK